MAVFTSLSVLNSFSGRPEDVLNFLKVFELWANIQKSGRCDSPIGCTAAFERWRFGVVRYTVPNRQKFSDFISLLLHLIGGREMARSSDLWPAGEAGIMGNHELPREIWGEGEDARPTDGLSVPNRVLWINQSTTSL